MSADVIIEDRANRLAALIEERLGVRGSGLETKLRRAGRALPRYVRREAGQIVQAVHLSANPKLARQVDTSGIEKAFRKCEKWLKTVDPKERRKDRVLGLLGVNAFNLILISGAFITWMVWSGNL